FQPASAPSTIHDGCSAANALRSPTRNGATQMPACFPASWMCATTRSSEPKRGARSSQSPMPASQPSSTWTISIGRSSSSAASTFSITSPAVTWEKYCDHEHQPGGTGRSRPGESRSPTAARTASRSGARNSSSPKRTARTPPPSSENATRPFPSPSAVGGVHDCRPSAYRVSMNAHLALSLWGENRRLTSERQEATVAEERLEQALFEIRKVIAGQDAMLERVLVCL